MIARIDQVNVSISAFFVEINFTAVVFRPVTGQPLLQGLLAGPAGVASAAKLNRFQATSGPSP